MNYGNSDIGIWQTYLLENEGSDLVTLRKAPDRIYCQWQNSSFEATIRILQNIQLHWDLDSFSIAKDLCEEIGGDSNESNFFILYNEMC